MYKLTCRVLHTYACDAFFFIICFTYFHIFYVYVCVCVRVGLCAGEWAVVSVIKCICTVYNFHLYLCRTLAIWLMFFVGNTTINKVYLILSYLISRLSFFAVRGMCVINVHIYLSVIVRISVLHHIIIIKSDIWIISYCLGSGQERMLWAGTEKKGSLISTLGPRKNGRNFAEYIFRCIYRNETGLYFYFTEFILGNYNLTSVIARQYSLAKIKIRVWNRFHN